MSLPINQVVVGDCTEIMRGWPADSIDLIVTSPPYWGLRSYGPETVRVWGGKPECEHEFEIGNKVENNLLEYKSGEWDRPSRRESAKVGSNKKCIVCGKEFKGKIGQKFCSIKCLNTLSNEERADSELITTFCSKCGAWSGSLGLEPHPQMFIDHIVEVCREIRRVMKPSGNFWLNLGDTYYSSSAGNKPSNVEEWGEKGDGLYKRLAIRHRDGESSHSPTQKSFKFRSNWLQPKQLLGIPWRIANALQHDAWILRNDIIWHKTNAMPSSVKDRLTNAYEHIFLFVKNNEAIYWSDRFTGQLESSKPIQYYVHNETGEKRFDRPKKKVDKDWYEEDEITRKFKYAWRGYDYYFDLDAIRKPHQSDSFKISARARAKDDKLTKHDIAVGRIGNFSYTDPLHTKEYHPVGKNPGDIWQIPTQPFKGAHFAVFPSALIEPIVKAGSPRWLCSKCGKPRIRITETNFIHRGDKGHARRALDEEKKGNKKIGIISREKIGWNIHETVGWSDCGCGEKWIPGIVMDPFGGSGTVGKVAHKLGRSFIVIEIKTEYTDMAHQRVRGKYKPLPKGLVKLDQFMEAER